MDSLESPFFFFFFFNDTATTEIYTLSLHDALPILPWRHAAGHLGAGGRGAGVLRQPHLHAAPHPGGQRARPRPGPPAARGTKSPCGPPRRGGRPAAGHELMDPPRRPRPPHRPPRARP